MMNLPENENGEGNPFLKAFSDPQAIKQYALNVERFLPGMEALHRMTGVLLAESVGDGAKILVLGAGGGLELRALASMNSSWRFIGIDPAPKMLELAAQTLGDLAAQVDLFEGYIDDAPAGPYDAAVSLLTLHFLQPADRTRTVAEIHRRLKPGAPFVVAHSSIPSGDDVRRRWLTRYAEYAIASGADPEMALAARDAIEASDMMLSPEEDEEILRKGGFSVLEPFYSAFTWRGWVGRS